MNLEPKQSESELTKVTVLSCDTPRKQSAEQRALSLCMSRRTRALVAPLRSASADDELMTILVVIVRQ